MSDSPENVSKAPRTTDVSKQSHCVFTWPDKRLRRAGSHAVHYYSMASNHFHPSPALLKHPSMVDSTHALILPSLAHLYTVARYLPTKESNQVTPSNLPQYIIIQMTYTEENTIYLPFYLISMQCTHCLQGSGHWP